LESILALLESGEEVLAEGLALQKRVVITDRRIIREGDLGPVSIPHSSVTGYTTQFEAHRWLVTLTHSPIDPRRRPSDARQWWRWHDRRAYNRETERMWSETHLAFSRERAAAADALAKMMDRRGLRPRELTPRPSGRSEGSASWKATLESRDD
jgi:hypothetical protein